MKNIHKNIYICSKHFRQECFKYTPRKLLIQGAIPDPYEVKIKNSLPIEITNQGSIFEDKAIENVTLCMKDKIQQIDEWSENDSPAFEEDNAEIIFDQQIIFDELFRRQIIQGKVEYEDG